MNTLVSSRPISFRPVDSLATRIASRVATGWSRLRQLLRIWAARDRARRELAGLDDATLRDIGMSRGDADFTAGKPFWQE